MVALALIILICLDGVGCGFKAIYQKYLRTNCCGAIDSARNDCYRADNWNDCEVLVLNEISGYDLIETMQRGLITTQSILPERIKGLNNPEMAAREQNYLDKVNFILANPMIIHQLMLDNVGKMFEGKEFPG
jgi:hypothetical protein